MPSSTVKRVPRRASSEATASEGSSSDDESGPQIPTSPIQSEDEEGSQGSGSESDHLDSVDSRKRRKVAPEAGETEEPVVSIVNVPSRIKRRGEHKPEPKAVPQPLHESPKTVTAPTDPNTTFESLNVRPWLVQSLANMAIRRPTGIQKGCIPEILKGRDCIGGGR